MRVFIFFMILALQAGNVPNAKVREEYQALLKQLDLEKHPARHAQAAAWCNSKNWKSQADLHDLEWRRYQHRKEEEKLKADPSASDLKRVLDLTVKLKLEAESAEARGAWLDAELKERRAKLKENDAAGLKALVAWAAKEEAGSRAAAVALELLKLEPAHETANHLLGRIKNGEEWIDPWDLLVKKGGLKDAVARAAVHKQLEALRPKKARVYPPDPFATCEKVLKPRSVPLWKDSIRAGDGKGVMFLHAPRSYTPTKAYPLVVELHGGGNGDFNYSLEGAFNMVHSYPLRHPNAEVVVVAPAARNHVMDSWKFRENALDVIDAVIDACQRFNIDRRRIYLAGASMGGQGVQVLSWAIPELFPAFCPQTGYYLNDRPCPDLTGKQYLIFHGGKDTTVGQKTHPIFLEKLRKAGAIVEFVFWPEEDHFLPHDKVMSQMIGFFEKKHALDYEPDLALVRRMIDEVLPWKDRPKEPVRAPVAAAPVAPPGKPMLPGSAIDLLAQVDPAKDAVEGTWRLEGKALLSPATDFARLQASVAVPEEYDLEVVAERSGSGKAEALVIGLVGGGESFLVGLDGWGGAKSGMEAIDGKGYNANETTHEGAVLASDKPNTILCAVRKDRVTVNVEGKPVLDWKADYKRVSLRKAWAMSGGKPLFVGSYKCAYRITKWVLHPGGAR